MSTPKRNGAGNGGMVTGAHRGVTYHMKLRPGLSTKYVAWFSVGGRRYDRGTGKELVNEAVVALHGKINEVLDAARRGASIEQLAAEYWRELAQSRDRGLLQQRTLDVYWPRLGRFLAFCKARGKEAPADLTEALLEEYRAYLMHEHKYRGRRLDPYTVTCEFTTVVGPVVRRAVQRGLLARNPLEGMKGWARSTWEPQPFERDEIAAVWRALLHQSNGRARRRFLRFQLWTGARLDQGRLLERDRLELDRRRAWVIPQKGDRQRKSTRDGRWIKLPRRVVRMLRAVPPVTAGSPYVFGEIRRNDPLLWLKVAAKKAGITRTVRVHDLRATCATWMLDNGAPIPHVAEQLGHHDWKTVQKYNRTRLRALDHSIELAGRRPRANSFNGG